MFRNRPMVVGTMHRKEQSISPVFQEELQVLPFVPVGFQTDFLGTFTGEVTRLQTAKETVKDKCLAAMQFSNCEMGIATEASFGPHPEVFYAAAHEEWMVFLDIKHGLEIYERVFTTNTNYAHQEISDSLVITVGTSKSNLSSAKLILKEKIEKRKAAFKKAAFS